MKTVVNKGGRPPLLDTIAIKEAMVEVRQRSICGQGFSRPNSFVDFIRKYARDTLVRAGVENATFVRINISERKKRALHQQFVPENLSEADKINRARFLSRINIAVSVFSAAVLWVALSGEGHDGKLFPQDPIKPRFRCYC